VELTSLHCRRTAVLPGQHLRRPKNHCQDIRSCPQQCRSPGSRHHLRRLAPSCSGLSCVHILGSSSTGPWTLLCVSEDSRLCQKLLTVLGLRAVPAHMALLLAVAAGNEVHVARLVAISSHVLLGTAIAASTRACLRTVLGEVSHYRWSARVTNAERAATHFHDTCDIPRCQDSPALRSRPPCDQVCCLPVSDSSSKA